MATAKRSEKKLSELQARSFLEPYETVLKKAWVATRVLLWPKVEQRLTANSAKLWSLNEMERTGGEPDIVGQNKKTGEYIVYDCSPESPAAGEVFVMIVKGRTHERKVSVKRMPSISSSQSQWELKLLTEEQYRELQKLGEFDTKTSSWVKTPTEIKKLGGALFL